MNQQHPLVARVLALTPDNIRGLTRDEILVRTGWIEALSVA